MKRAVSSIDASAATHCSTRRGKLKRCKSAFANLKRLGAIASSGTCIADAAGEESLLPRWRQHGSSPDVISTGSKPMLVSSVASGADSLLAHSLRSGTSASTSSLGRLFSGDVSDGSSSSHSTFATSLNFHPVPEGEVYTDDERYSWTQDQFSPPHSPTLQQRQQRNSPQRQHRCSVSEKDDGATAADCGSGSSEFSIVGFGDFFDAGFDEAEEEMPSLAAVAAGSGRMWWSPGIPEVHEEGDVSSGRSSSAASHARGRDAISANSGSPGGAATPELAEAPVPAPGDGPGASASEERSPGLVMMRLQRRFEKMLLVSNVAT